MRCLLAYISPLLCFSHAHLRSNVGIIPGISDASASHPAFPSDPNVAALTTTVAKAQREQTTAAQRQGANAKQSDAAGRPWEGEFQYVPKYKIMFCGIPKNGIRNLRRFTQALQFSDQPQKNDTLLLPGMFGKSDVDVMSDVNDTSWRKFVILREPHDRFLSAYLNKCGLPLDHPRMKKLMEAGKFSTRTKFEHGSPFVEEAGKLCIRKNFTHGSFRSIVSYLKETNLTGFRKFGNYHWIPQSGFCLGISPKQLSTQWQPIILERSGIRRDLQEKVCNTLASDESRSKCSNSLNEFYPPVDDHDNHFTNATNFIREFYDRTLWDTVSEIYAEDMKLYKAAGGKIMTWDDVDQVNKNTSNVLLVDAPILPSSGDLRYDWG